MTKFLCDKCGREMGNRPDTVEVPDRHVANKKHQFELCHVCMNELEHWLLPLPQIAKGN